jgi:hypothetical protein
MARYSGLTQKTKEIIGDRKLAMGFGRFLARMGASHPWWGKFAMGGGQMLEQSTHIFDRSSILSGLSNRITRGLSDRLMLMWSNLLL